MLNITRLALRTLEDVAAQGAVGIVERTWGHRLALEWLVTTGIAQRWQARAFWRDMGELIRDTTFPHGEHYIRSTMLDGALENWHHGAGVKREDCVVREKWTRAYAPEMVDIVHDRMNHLAMCNRYRPGERKRVTDYFSARVLREYNEGPAIVHPREPGPVIRLENGESVLEQMTWGFPVVLRGKRGQPLKPKPVNNARFDKLSGFWKYWAVQPGHRCLIPTEGYAEAVGRPGEMTTAWLSLKSAPVFAWAGLWRVSDEWGSVYTGVMTDNAPELNGIHDRSPVILAPEDWQAWLTAPLEDLYCFDRPWPAEDVRVEEMGVLWKDGGRELVGPA